MMWYLFGVLLLTDAAAAYYLLKKIKQVRNDLSGRVSFVNEKVYNCLLDFQQRSDRRTCLIIKKIKEAKTFNVTDFHGAEELEIAGIKLIHMSGEWRLDNDYGLTPQDKQIIMQHMRQRQREIVNERK